VDLIDKINDISSRIEKQKDHIGTEEATKNAFIMPFINALGYDIFNPLEVIPEFTADVGSKKGEKVDYAIKKGDDVIILIECKWSGDSLSKDNAAQLKRYFHVTDARFGILTNGIVYKFYSDLDQPNKMDTKPFFEVDLTDFESHQIKELKKFSKSTFSINNILTTASKLKYTHAIKKVLIEELENPSEEFVRFFLSRVYDGVKRQNVIDEFTEIVKDARSQFINDQITNRLKSAMMEDNKEQVESDETTTRIVDDLPSDRGIITTEDEIEGFNIIKAILREVVDVKRIFMRDTKSYCGILLDDNNRKPVCRLHFNCSQKYIGTLNNEKKEVRTPIDSLDDLFGHADIFKSIINSYLSQET